jgi:hypothetical protein
MARIVVLDSGPRGDACRKRGKPFVERFVNGRIEARANGVIIAVPEIADYDVQGCSGRSVLVSGTGVSSRESGEPSLPPARVSVSVQVDLVARLRPWYNQRKWCN